MTGEASGVEQEERVSRRDLLRKMVGSLAEAVGGAAAERPTPQPVLQIPYVPYTSHPALKTYDPQVKEEE